MTTFLAVMVLTLCVHSIFKEYRWLRRQEAWGKRFDHLITILERPTSASKQEEVQQAGESTRRTAWGAGNPGQRERLGEEERRANP